MKFLRVLLALVLLSGVAWSDQAASNFAREAASVSQLVTQPENLRLRLVLLANRAKRHADGARISAPTTLQFFSSTRIMFWNGPTRRDTELAMQALERAALEFARARNLQVDVPPVGNAPTVGLQHPQPLRQSRSSTPPTVS